MSTGKGNMVSLRMFESWGCDVFGKKLSVVDGKEMVNFMWCKLCAKYKTEISQHLKGVALTSALAMAEVTNYVAKHSVKRHCDPSAGKAHNFCLTLEKRDPASTLVESTPVLVQTSIINTTKLATEQAHRKLLQTAYHLAMTPTMPLTDFEVLVKVQRTNGVRLIQGKHDERSAKEYMSAIAEAVEEKCAVILASKNFMTILSDGSQARKNKTDKELVLIRIERNGLPCYIVASLIEMSKWGGTGAEALKDEIDDVFISNGGFDMSTEDYKPKLVEC